MRLLVGEARSGKPQAINRMRREASGEVLLMTDVRQTLAPDCLRRLLEVLGNPAVGVRFRQPDSRRQHGRGILLALRELAP